MGGSALVREVKASASDSLFFLNYSRNVSISNEQLVHFQNNIDLSIKLERFYLKNLELPSLIDMSWFTGILRIFGSNYFRLRLSVKENSFAQLIINRNLFFFAAAVRT